MSDVVLFFSVFFFFVQNSNYVHIVHYSEETITVSASANLILSRSNINVAPSRSNNIIGLFYIFERKNERKRKQRRRRRRKKLCVSEILTV